MLALAYYWWEFDSINISYLQFMILDYSAHVIETYDKIHEDFFNPVYYLANSPFFKKYTKHCRFCKTKLKTPHRESEENGGAFDHIEIIYDCPTCGWWYYTFDESIYVGEGGFFQTGTNIWGLLRRYSEKSKDIPLAALRAELRKKPEIIYKLHPTKFEELVGSVFKDFFLCEVKHVGKTNDGGIDLILVRSDSDAIIQVKRREKPNSTEGVSVIRELLGTIKLSEKRNGIFVTSANKFSGPAIKASEKATKLNLVDKLELIDYKKFVDTMGLVSDKIERPWKNLITS